MNGQYTISSSELGYLWGGYVIDSMSSQFLRVFTEHAVQPNIKQLVNLAWNTALKQNEERKALFLKEQIALPVGFSDGDSDPAAPRLFQDDFYLHYLNSAARLGALFFSLALATAVRKDLRMMAVRFWHNSAEISNLARDIMLAKGIDIRPPHIPLPEKAEFIQKTSFLNGLFSDKRPLSGMEIACLYSGIELFVLIKTVCMAFAQVAQDKTVSQLFAEAKASAESQAERLRGLLKDGDLPVPLTYETAVTDSGKAPFSDRLMLCHGAGLFGAAIQYCGVSLGSSFRHDVAAVLAQTVAAVGAFSERFTRMLIDREWLEKPPCAADRSVPV